jgi:hypothetical protein
MGGSNWGADAPRRFFGDAHWREPLKWNRKAEAAGVRRRVFCMSMGDWAEGRPDQHPHLERLWNPTILETPWLDWLMLTKRPQLITKLCPLGRQSHPSHTTRAGVPYSSSRRAAWRTILIDEAQRPAMESIGP